VFARAAEILGGNEQLARYLKIRMRSLEKWSTGAERPPAKILEPLAHLLKHQILTKHKMRVREARREKDS
jgi:DNA-binding transcriptional regulator YiaG